jgi:DNA polymerase (family X)
MYLDPRMDAARLPPATPAANQRIADRLREAAQLLEAQGAPSYRADAYRKAAESLERLPRDVRVIYENEGLRGLDDIPRVGLGIATAIAEMLATQRWGQLDRLRGAAEPEKLFQAVPGMGPELARRIHEKLHIDSLEALETAANDGRLESVAGIGPRRVAALRAVLDDMLGRIRGRAGEASDPSREPGVDLLLAVDREYAGGVEAGTLHRIAPRRFNPENVAWLPVLHTQHGPWSFTALFSNSALAHRMGRNRDWVIVYFYDGDHVERQRTVVTETHGVLAGRRVVRGRESECIVHYANEEGYSP